MSSTRAAPTIPTSETSFLLLKPDAIRRGLEPAVLAEISLGGLAVLSRRELVLYPELVRALWSEYCPERHPLTFAFLDRYLCGGPSVTLSVTGHDAFEVTRRIKRTIRSRFSEGVFANVIHTAETREELARQYHLLTGSGDTTCGPPLACSSLPSGAALLRPAGLPSSEVDAGLSAIDRIWHQLDCAGGRLPKPVPVRLGQADVSNQWGVLFGVDSHNSVDSAVAAVKRSIPGLDLVDALHLAIYAGRADGHLIAIGPEHAARSCFEALRSHGIRNCKVVALEADTL